MIRNFFRKLKLAFKDKGLRNKILFILGAILVFRLLAAIPIPGIDHARLADFFSNNQFFSLLGILSGGGLSGLSIVMLGVGPYITASIIMQLMTMISPKLKTMYHEEGEVGRKKFTQMSRLLTVPIAMIQGFGLLLLLRQSQILPELGSTEMVLNILVIVAGAVLVTWIGELITEFGIGNGVSILIFAGIVASLPGAIKQTLFAADASQIPTIIAFVAVAIAITYGVVVMTEAERPVPVTYARQVRGGSSRNSAQSYIPLRVNSAGVMPIIFALSILLIPQMIGNFLIGVDSSVAQSIAGAMNSFVNNQLAYGITYFVFVFLFTYFYTAVTFEPDSVAKNLQRNGAFVPGIRPGEATSKYLGDVITRITLVGALFLGFIAILPLIVQYATGIQSLSIGGTALLIAVSVVIDLVKKVDSQLSMREY